MTGVSPIIIEAAGFTEVGKVRSSNEDTLLIDPSLGLFAVFDGMGGAMAGEVAATMARDAVQAHVARSLAQQSPIDRLESALSRACATVFEAAQADRTLHGMGTTAVACLVPDLQEPSKAVIAHVGDSRAYLLRNGRMSQLTRDHTIVAELVARGMVTAEEAEIHPHKNVLSRNLGARLQASIDVIVLELQAGDRLMLCSDGLHGFASNEAIQYLLGSGDAAQDVAKDLVDLALRGGGGDNVTVLVIDAGTTTSVATASSDRGHNVRTRAAAAWWQQRPHFIEVATQRGLGRSPLCGGIPAEEAIELVAGSFAEAVYHDLEKATGVNVWTFAQNLGAGWLDHGGQWPVLRAVLDLLRDIAVVIVATIRDEDPRMGALLDIEVTRSLTVSEFAVGTLLADRLRGVERELVELHAAAAVAVADSGSAAPTFVEHPTIPFLRSSRGISISGAGREVVTAVNEVLTLVRAAAPPDALLVHRAIAVLEATVLHDQDPSAAVAEARELYGVRTLDEVGVLPLFDVLEYVRTLITDAVYQLRYVDAIKASALRVLNTCQYGLVATITDIILEAVEPGSRRLREIQRVTTGLRAQLEHLERQQLELDRRKRMEPADEATEPIPPLPPVAPSGEDTIPSFRDPAATQEEGI